MQGDKFQQKKQKKSHSFVASIVIQLPLSQWMGKAESEVLQRSHIGMCFFWREGEVVKEIAEAGVHNILFVLFQLIHPHDLKGCSGF